MTMFRAAKTPPATPRPAGTPARTEAKGSGSRGADIPFISHERIAQRAYDIYAQRGYAPGNPVDDWYEAERQLRAGL
jgi:hypothetical protein